MDQIVCVKPLGMPSIGELGRHSSAPARYVARFDECSPHSDDDCMQVQHIPTGSTCFDECSPYCSTPLNIPDWLECTPTVEYERAWPQRCGQGPMAPVDRTSLLLWGQSARQQCSDKFSLGDNVESMNMQMEAADCSPLPHIPDWLECTPIDAYEHAWPLYHGPMSVAAAVAQDCTSLEQKMSKPFVHDYQESLSSDSKDDLKAFTARTAAASLHDPLTVQTKADGTTIVAWKFDRRKLMSKDTKLVSQHFEVPLSNQQKVPFMVILDPKPCGEGRCAKRFEKCETGVLSLKCQDTALAVDASVSFRIGLSGRYACDSPRGPVTHDFGIGSSLCGLHVRDENWTLMDAIDEETGTVSVRLEIASLPYSVQSK